MTPAELEAAYPLLPGEDHAGRLRRLREELGNLHPATQAAFDARWAEAMAEELDGITGLWWLSFVDDAQDRWLGVCVVEASGPLDAVQRSLLAGCNPGGEVAVQRLPPDAVAVEWQDRLLTMADIEAMPAIEGLGG